MIQGYPYSLHILIFIKHKENSRKKNHYSKRFISNVYIKIFTYHLRLFRFVYLYAHFIVKNATLTTIFLLSIGCIITQFTLFIYDFFKTWYHFINAFEIFQINLQELCICKFSHLVYFYVLSAKIFQTFEKLLCFFLCELID